ncbi:MAG: bifunctional precorrin-2 dehydrogenase/sirohydrochlorin ferrochelatase [Actinomycetota bacterium]
MPETSDNRYYLAALDLTDQRVLVVGGNDVAAEKVAGLRAAGAAVVVVAPSISGEVEALLSEHVQWVERDYQSSDLDGCMLAIATTGDDSTGQAVARDARSRNMLVNVADVPALCNFILPAIVRRGPIAVAVSTAGASPALAQRIRREIGDMVGPAYADLAAELEALREWAKESLPTYEARKAFFDSIVNGSPDPIEVLSTGGRDRLLETIEAAKADAMGAAQ